MKKDLAKVKAYTKAMADSNHAKDALSSSVGICKEICLITVGLTEANVATVLAGWLPK